MLSEVRRKTVLTRSNRVVLRHGSVIYYDAVSCHKRRSLQLTRAGLIKQLGIAGVDGCRGTRRCVGEQRVQV